MRIPEVREAFLTLAQECSPNVAKEIKKLVQEMYRRSAVRKNSTNRPDVPKHEIQAFAATHPEHSYQEIAEVLGVRSIGRISEALAGYRS